MRVCRQRNNNWPWLLHHHHFLFRHGCPICHQLCCALKINSSVNRVLPVVCPVSSNGNVAMVTTMNRCLLAFIIIIYCRHWGLQWWIRWTIVSSTALLWKFPMSRLYIDCCPMCRSRQSMQWHWRLYWWKWWTTLRYVVLMFFLYDIPHVDVSNPVFKKAAFSIRFFKNSIENGIYFLPPT
jgi:hypothetical protein